MSYILDKEGLEKLAIEVFGPERTWVKAMQGERWVPNPDFSGEEGDEEDEDGEPEFIEENVNSVDIYVHFPEITITNSKDQKHKLYNLFTRFRVIALKGYDDFKCTVNFDGMRTTYTINECNSRYAHSHLCNIHSSFDDFCTGDSYYNSLLNMDLRMNPTEENWLMLFMGLEKFVSWESKEGGPYFHFENLASPGSSTSVSNGELKSELRRIMHLMPKQVWAFTDRLKLIENHPLLYEFFDNHSNIRKLGGMSDDKAKEYIKQYEDAFKGVVMKWKEGTSEEKIFPFEVLHEFSGEGPQIDREIVDRYIAILKQQAEQYNKNLSYEHAKNKWGPKAFTEIGIIS